MAPFNKYIPTTEENYLGYSKGVDAPKPNLALAKLFSGMGDLVNEGVHGGTQLLDIKLENEAEKAGKGLNQDVSMSLEDAATLGKFKNKVDTGAGSTLGGSPEPVGSSQVSSGSGGATTLAEGGGNEPAQPVEVQKGLSTLDNLYTLYQQGKLSPTYWMTRQQMVVQQLKARFPGSEAQIDQAIHRVTQPANQIRNQVFADFQAAATAANAQNKWWDAQVDKMSPFLGEEGIRAARDPSVYGDRAKQTDIIAKVAGQEAYIKNMQTRHAEMSNDILKGQVDTQKAERALTLDLNGKIISMMTGALNPLTPLQKQIDQAQATGEFTPEFIRAANAQLTDMERTVDEQFRAHVNTPRFENNQSYASLIKDPAVLNKITSQAKEQISILKDAINNNQTGLVGALTRNIELQKDYTAGQLLTNSADVRTLAGMEKALGGQGNLTSKILLDNDTQALAGTWKAVRDRLLAEKLRGTGSPAPASTKDDTGKDPPPQVPKNEIKDINTLITDPQSTPEMRKNAVTYLTNDTKGDFFKGLDKPSQLQAFNALTTPDMSKNIYANGPESWTKYKMWGQNIFNSMTMARAGDIQTLVNSNKLTYNPTTNQLEVGKPFPNVAGERYPEKETLDQINNSLRNIGNINSLDKTDPATSMTPLFRGLKVPVQQPTTGTGKRSSVEGGNLSRLAYAPEGNNSENPLANIGGGEGFSSVSSSRVAAISKLPINSTVESVAEKHDFDANALKAIIHIESSGKPTATTGKYKGLMQLSNEEFSRYGRKGGSIYNAADNVEAGVKSLKAKQAWFEDRVGRPPSITELYLIHQQGPGGLLAHERNPDAPAWENMYSTAEGQHRGPTWAKKAIWGNVPTDMKRQFGSVDNITSADFIKMWEAKLRGKTHG